MKKYKPHNRRKLVWITVLMIVALFVSMTDTAFANNHSNNHNYAYPSLETLIDIRVENEDYNRTETQHMIDRIGHFPKGMINQITQVGGTLILMDIPLTDLSEFNSLKGEVPRGWESTGLTWDEVPGAGGLTSAARIGHSKPGNGHSTINLELHEFSHALDRFLKSDTISDSNEFRAIKKEEKESLFPGNAYFDYTEEYFAESMALFYLGGEHQAKLRNNAPKTYVFIQQLDKEFGGSGGDVDLVIPEIPEVPEKIAATLDSFDTVTLNWDVVKDANYYIIMRNEEEIDTTTEPTFTDKGLNETKEYNYSIIAVNEEGPSEKSSIISIQTEKDPEQADIPNIPKHVVASPDSATTITLTWDDMNNIDHFIVFRNGNEISKTTKPIYVDKNIDEASTYNYSVAAVNKKGSSDKSKTVKITTTSNANKKTRTDKRQRQADSTNMDDSNKNKKADKDSDQDEAMDTYSSNQEDDNTKTASNRKSITKNDLNTDSEKLDENGEKETLPPMATQSYNFILIGAIIIFIGIGFIIIRKKRKDK